LRPYSLRLFIGAHLSVLWSSVRVLQEFHVAVFEVPQEGRVVEPPALGDGLGVAPKLPFPNHEICTKQTGCYVANMKKLLLRTNE
jgi:hypothetical protein